MSGTLLSEGSNVAVKEAPDHPAAAMESAAVMDAPPPKTCSMGRCATALLEASTEEGSDVTTTAPLETSPSRVKRTRHTTERTEGVEEADDGCPMTAGTTKETTASNGEKRSTSRGSKRGSQQHTLAAEQPQQPAEPQGSDKNIVADVDAGGEVDLQQARADGSHSPEKRRQTSSGATKGSLPRSDEQQHHDRAPTTTHPPVVIADADETTELCAATPCPAVVEADEADKDLAARDPAGGEPIETAIVEPQNVVEPQEGEGRITCTPTTPVADETSISALSTS